MSVTWKDVGSAVSKAAPVLGTVLGGPVGAIVGSAGALVASALGCEVDPSEVSKAVKDDPEAFVKLKELEVQNRANLITWQTEQLKAEVADRKSAREMAVSGGLTAKLFWLSAVMLVGAVTLDVYILKTGFAPGISGELVGRVLGFTEGLASSLMMFWFGGTGTSQQHGDLAQHLFTSAAATKAKE